VFYEKKIMIKIAIGAGSIVVGVVIGIAAAKGIDKLVKVVKDKKEKAANSQ
jgi:F0F1-type ATP synthase membrane subunit c/vacuolar-type H+-ATPase subunit K